MKRLLLLCTLFLASLSFAQGPPAPYSVTTQWTPSTSSGITGQNVYRAPWTLPTGPCGTYAVLTVTPLAPSATSYVDSTVTPVSTYCYFVTALSSTGESGPSNVVSNVQIPPLPPSNLTGKVQ